VSEWRECSLNEVGTLARGKSQYRPRYAFHLYGGKYPFVQTGEIKASRKYIRIYEKTYSEDGLAQSKLWKKGTLCITIAANIAELGILSFDACFPDSVIGFTPDQDKSDVNFIYYSLLFFQKELKHLGEGSVQDNINLSTFDNLIFPIPPLPEQKAIASVLSSLDDKIDLLHRQNKTLEAMAETLFRQWFIEEAQDDWEEKSLYDCIELIGGGTPQTSVNEYWNGDILWISAKDITPNHKGVICTTEKKITREGLENSSTKILPKFSMIISARGTVGKYALLLEDMAFSQSNYGIIPNYSKCYFFTYLLVANVVDELISAAYGSVFDTITTKTFKEQYVMVPTENEIINFEKKISPFFMGILNNSKQIRTLEKLRDNLLPKLMSGEVRVNYA
jgi:type I restriction enzyme, S subunit